MLRLKLSSTLKLYERQISELQDMFSEINLCIHIANLAKNMMEETEDFSAYLMSDNGEWGNENMLLELMTYGENVANLLQKMMMSKILKCCVCWRANLSRENPPILGVSAVS